ncbi:unnamed protein product [Urochloa humidicola]
MSSTATSAAMDVILPPIRIAALQAPEPTCSAATSPSTTPPPNAEYVALTGVRERRPPSPRPRRRPPPGAFQDPQPAEYERERAQRITRNNKMLQSVGIPALAYILNSSNAKGKGIDHGVVDKVSETTNTTRSVIIPTRGTRGPKRVLAEPIQQGLDARMTRKRTSEQSGEEGSNGTSTNEEMSCLQNMKGKGLKE